MSNVITTQPREGFNILNNLDRTEQEILAHPAVKIAKDFYDNVVANGYGHEFGVEVRTDWLDDTWEEIEIDVFFNYDRSNCGAICRDAKNLYRTFMRAKGLKLDWIPQEVWLPAPERQTIIHEADVVWGGSIERSKFITDWLSKHKRENTQLELFPNKKEFICSAKELTIWTPWDKDCE